MREHSARLMQFSVPINSERKEGCPTSFFILQGYGLRTDCLTDCDYLKNSESEHLIC